jgi:glycosyltransferase involved in cell wall biosynthesis
MKVLFDHPDPFTLAHGGFQIQIEQTRAALLAVGVEVEYLEWWNSKQKGDIIHYFGRPRAAYIEMAHTQGIKVVLGELLTAAGSRSGTQLALQKFSTQVFRRILPSMYTARLAWDSYRIADACIALTAWEAHLMHYLFGAPKGRVHVLPNGVEEAFLNASPAPARGPWLVCTATIAPRKRVLELAEAAIQAQTPVWIIGKPYSEADPYVKRYMALAQAHPEFIKTDPVPFGARAQLAEVYNSARGFVLLSAMETRSGAAEEAAACGCPLLLSDLPWARSVFGENATYCPIADVTTTAKNLKAFYDAAPSMPAPPKPESWPMVGEQLKQIYQSLLTPNR